METLHSSVMRQKGESQNGCFKKTKHAKYSEKRTFLAPFNISYVRVLSGGKKCSFFGKFVVLCFFETPILRFALLPYYQRTSRHISWDWPSQGSNQDKIDHLTNEEQGHYGNIILWNILNTYLHTYLSLKTAPLMTLLPVKITQIWWLENWKYFDVPSLQLDELCPTVFMKKIIWHYCHWIVVILFTLSQFANK